MSSRRSNRAWGRRPLSAIARWVSSRGAPGGLNDAPQLLLAPEQRGLKGTDRADPVRAQELRNCALRELRTHAPVLGVQVAPQIEASARPDRSGAR
eukprot:15451944-Alexandrium_andersonii.AAC.1